MIDSAKLLTAPLVPVNNTNGSCVVLSFSKACADRMARDKGRQFMLAALDLLEKRENAQ